jgi:broad specificity phosphatase PhoE
MAAAITCSDRAASVSCPISEKEEKEPSATQTITLIAMRHGESVANVARKVSSSLSKEIALTKLGQQQVHESAKKLRDQIKKVDFIFTSPLERTRQTTAIVASYFDISEIIVDDRLKEPSFGIFEDKSFDEYIKVFPKKGDWLITAPPDGESGLSLKERTVKFLEEIGQNPKFYNKTILVGTHFYTICHMCNYFNQKWAEPFLNAQYVTFALKPL